MPTMLLVNSASFHVSMLPQTRGHSPDDRALEIEGALDWMRYNPMVYLLTTLYTALDKFNKAGSIPMTHRSPEKQARELAG
jgi:hypothetical protein